LGKLFKKYFGLETELFQTSSSERIKRKQADFEKMRKKKLRRLQTTIQEIHYDLNDRFGWNSEPIVLIKVKIS